MLAVSAMDPTLTFVFYLVAVVLFVVAALGVSTRISLGWLGLACFAIPPMWNALALT